MRSLKLVFLVVLCLALVLPSFAAKSEWARLNSKAVSLHKRGKYAQGEKYARRAVKIAETQYKHDPSYLETSLYNLAAVLKMQAKYSEAVSIYKRCLAIREDIYGNNHNKVASALNGLATVRFAQGKYSQAEPLFKRSLQIKEDEYGKDHPKVATAINNLAAIYKAQANYAKAESLCRRSLNIWKKSHGENNAKCATLMNNVGWLLNAQGKLFEAEPYYRGALSIRRKVLGKNDHETAQSMNNLGSLLQAQGRYAEAERLYISSIKIYEKTLGPTHPDVARTISNLASFLTVLGKYSEAEPLNRRALAIREKTLGKNHPDVANSLNNLAVNLQCQGKYAEAETLLRRCIKIRKEILDVNHPDLGNSMSNLAWLFEAQGKYPEAESLYKQAIELVEDKLGCGHPSVASPLNFLAGLYAKQGLYSKAEQFFKRALNIRVNGLGKDHYRTANVLSSLGDIAKVQGNYTEAENLYKQALEIKRRSLGNDSPKVRGEVNSLIYLSLTKNDFENANSLLEKYPKIKENNSFSYCLLNLYKREYEKARNCYRQKVIEAEKSGDFEDRFISYTGVGKAHEGLIEYNKALEFYTKAVDMTEELRASLAPSDRKNFYDVESGGFYRSEPAKGVIRIKLKLKDKSPGIYFSELTRARSLTDGIVQRSLKGLAGVPKKVLAEEERLVYEAAGLRKARADKPKNENPERWENLTEQIEEADLKLEKFAEMLWKKHKAYAAIKYPRPVKLKEASIKPDEYVVLFDMVGDGVGIKLIQGKKIKATYYIDWNNDELTKEVETFLRPFHEVDMEGFDAKLGKSLCKRLLMKVLQDVPENAPLTIIPDGVLATLPFEALVMDGEPKYKGDQGKVSLTGLTFVGDKHPISYYQSITALTLARTLGKKKKQGARTLVMADPVFDVKDARFTKKKQTRIATSGAEAYKNLMVAMQDGKTGLTNVKRLPLTGKLADELKGLYGKNADVITGLKVNKGDFFKKIAPKISRYKNVIFATHGYYGTDLPGIQEPVLLFSLTPPGTDGFLRMTEIMSLDMNADTVALTACQTGLGKHVSGEGVMNLGRAFQYAGAKSVLMSLWSVSEAASVDLVKNFFQYRNDGKSKLEALQLARRDIRKAGYDHPFFWAAFILVGKVN